MKDIFEKEPKKEPSRASKLLEKIENTQQIDEKRKYVDASNREKIGIDQPHAPNQQAHAHLEDGRAVNKDGSISHGGKPFYLTKDQAAALTRADFKIPKSRLIEREDGGKITVQLEPALVELLEYLKKSLD